MQENPSSNPLTTQHPDTSRAIARQAILDDYRTVIGYELFDRTLESDARSASSDAQLLFNALSLAETDVLASRKTIFVNCTHQSLAGGHLELVAPERVVLEIPALPISQLDQINNHLPNLQQLHRRGFRLAFDYSVLTQQYEAWLPLASFIKFDLSILKPEAVAGFVKLAQAKTEARLIASNVQTDKQFTLVKDLGVKLFQGSWFAKPVIVEGQRAQAAQANIIRLIDLVRKQSSTNDIEALLKHDPMLSFNLLRFINSAGFGLRSEVTSFKHAVMLLGLNRLFKWAALLMTTSNHGGTPPAVGTTAVVRGRLMEMLAQEKLPPEDCDNAFVVGVFSMLDTMLGMPMDAALATLTLPSQVNEALLLNSGPLAPFLELTIACESNDDVAFAKATQSLGLASSHVNWCHLQALVWAESIGA